jgi:hypothetical protein
VVGRCEDWRLCLLRVKWWGRDEMYEISNMETR